jgi:opacity protein-like surface antigen
MVIRKYFGVLAGCVAALVPSMALSADYDPPIYVEQAADEYQPVEVGSGWYLRGDVSYDFKRGYKNGRRFADDYVIDDSYISDLGWIGPVDLNSVDDSRMPVSVSLGAGFHINDYVRAELNVGATAEETFAASGHIWSGIDTGGGTFTTFPDWTDSTPQPDFGCLGSRTTTTATTTTTPQPDLVTPQAPIVTTDPNTGVITVTPQPDIVTPQPNLVNTTSSQSTDPAWRRDCALNANASSKMYNGTADLYFDLGTFAGFTPYIGGGVGLLYNRNKAAAYANCDSEVRQDASTTGGPLPSAPVTQTNTTYQFDCALPAGNHQFFEYDEATYNLLYSLSAGLAYKVSDNTSIDLGYTFKSAPGMEYYTISDTDIEKRTGYNSHQVKVGLRYDLW